MAEESTVYVGVARLVLHIPEARSLKEKRSAIRSLVDRLRSRHRVLVLEVDGQELHQRATLAVCAISTDSVDLESRLQRVFQTVESSWSGHILGWEVELIDM